MELFIPKSQLEAGVLIGSIVFVWTLFQLLPFKYRKQNGLVQYSVIFALAYGLYVVACSLFFSTESIEKTNSAVISPMVKSEAHWQVMTVRDRLHLRSCPGTHCESLLVLESGEKINVDINSNNNNWLKAKVNNQNGYVSSLWLER